MPLHSASYFAGVGTVVATMAIGFGGGVVLTDAFVGKSERTPTRIERRAAPLAESTPTVAPAPAPVQQAESRQAAAPAAPQPPVVEQQVSQQAAATQQPPPVPQQQAAAPQTSLEAQQRATQPPPTRPQSGPGQAQFENSMGQVREADLRQRDADAKRTATAERHKQERRKWAERRKREMEQVDELTAVTEKVKQIERTRERDPVRSFAAESRPPASPVFRLFGSDDNDD